MNVASWLIDRYKTPFLEIPAHLTLGEVLKKISEDQLDPAVTYLVVKRDSYAVGLVADLAPRLSAEVFAQPVGDLTLHVVDGIIDDHTSETSLGIEARLLSTPDTVYLVLEDGRVTHLLHNPAAAAKSDAARLMDYFTKLSAEQDGEPVLRGRKPDAEVSFSAFFPPEAQINRQYEFRVYAYVAAHYAKIKQDVESAVDVLGDAAPGEMQAEMTSRIKNGTLITVRLDCDDLNFTPLVVEGQWNGKWLRFTYQFTPSGALAGREIKVRVGIYTCGEIASISACPIKIVPEAFSETHRENPLVAAAKRLQERTAKNYRRIFISYAHEDTRIAELFRQFQTATGDIVFMDYESIRAGQNWQEELVRAITEADVFQLFWSEHSSSSEHVRYEWDYALNHVCTIRGMDGTDFIRPVFWQRPLPAPPQPLGHLHFQYLKLPETLV